MMRGVGICLAVVGFCLGFVGFYLGLQFLLGPQVAALPEKPIRTATPEADLRSCGFRLADDHLVHDGEAGLLAATRKLQPAEKACSDARTAHETLTKRITETERQFFAVNQDL